MNSFQYLRFLADAIASFIWGSYLKTTGAHGAPVDYFRHVNNLYLFLFLT
jgi:hypothetical protein